MTTTEWRCLRCHGGVLVTIDDPGCGKTYRLFTRCGVLT
jgi:hypothetical protein